MIRSALAFTLLVGTAAAQPPARGARPPRTPAPPPGTVAIFADTAAVRRMCAQPDSVMAGRKPCVLRNDVAQFKVF